jgi:predicted nucleic acid-binding protein
MSVTVVDASALGALVFGEPEADALVEELAGASLVAPELIWYELSSICLKKIRKYPSRASTLMAAFKTAGKLKIRLVTVDHAAVIELARRFNLTTYDASYMWLAAESGGRLLTLDKPLDAANRHRLDKK